MLRFISIQTFTLERMTFIRCGIELVSIKNAVITSCTFKNSSTDQGAIWSQSSTSIDITSYLYVNNSATYGGAVRFYRLTGDVSITNCTFENNSGGAVRLYGPTGDVTITNCTLQNNSATGGGAVWLFGSTSNVSITSVLHISEQQCY